MYRYLNFLQLFFHSSSPIANHSLPTQPIIAVVVGLIAFVLFFYLLKYLRRQHENPKYIPTSFLKRKWSSWKPTSGGSYRTANDHLEPISESGPGGRRSRQPPSSFNAAAATAVQRAEAGTTGGVDRNTSVRSVMTLPPYNPKAGETEQVLGREGERGGIDVVVEYPESVTDQEAMREQEMEALYQVRLARRQEAAEREERRRLRREARERNDFVALRELRTETRASDAARGERTLEELRGEHARIRDRQRAVSSVSYADLGVARHDGTRLRANSEESERPLLGDTASIAASSRHHRRDRSASSVLSIDSDFPSPGLSRRSRANSGATSQRRASGQMSSPELIDGGDLGDEDLNIPGHSPPEYEHISLDDGQGYPEAPPDYQSPVEPRIHVLPPSAQDAAGSEARDQAGQPTGTQDRRSSRGVGGVPQLPSLRLASLPSIVVNTPTPINPRRSEDSGTHEPTRPAEGV